MVQKKATKCQKKTQYSIFKIATCEAFLKEAKIFNLKKRIKTMHHRKKKHEQKVLESLFTSLYCTKFMSPISPIMKLFSINF